MLGNPLGPRSRHSGQDIVEIGPAEIPVPQCLDDPATLRNVALGKTRDVEEVDSFCFVEGCELLPQLLIGGSMLRSGSLR